MNAKRLEPSYKISFPTDQQVTLEERIAALVFDNTTADEEASMDVGRQALMLVVRELRPDLVREVES